MERARRACENEDMNRVEVNPALLRWARERAGFSIERLLGKFPQLEEWESGRTQPTLRQLERFAHATFAPFGFLFLKAPPEETPPIPHYRTTGGAGPRRPSPNLLDTIYLLQQRQWWMREYLIEEGHDPLPFVASAPADALPTGIAERMRDVLGFGPRWAATQDSWEAALRTLRQRMDEAGIIVVTNGVVGNNTRRTLDVDEFRGFVLVDEYVPFVFVNNRDAKAAQMFTLAHELAHVVYGSSASFDLRSLQPARDDTEGACNRAAAEFLVPAREVRRVWNDLKDAPDPYSALAQQFKVSVIVAARRALDVRLITTAAFREFYDTWQRQQRRQGSRVSGGGNFYDNQHLRLGRRFTSAVVRKTQSGEMSYTEAYRLTGLHGRTFEQYATHLGIGGGR